METFILNEIIRKEVDRIFEAVHRVTGCGIDVLVSDSHVRHIITAKTIACYFLHEMYRDPYVVAAALNRTRSNTYHLLKKHGDLMTTDRLYRQYVVAVEDLLKSNRHETEKS